jgi:ATP synthase protein I
MVVVLLIKPEHTISVIVGASAFIVPHSFFAYWAFRYAGATKNNLVAQSFNQGLKVKLALTIIFFAIAFSQLNAAPSAIFGAYAVALISQAVAMAVLSYKASK